VKQEYEMVKNKTAGLLAAGAMLLTAVTLGPVRTIGQTGPAPEATAIPVRPGHQPAQNDGSGQAIVQPASTQDVLWTPGSGQLGVSGGKVSVVANSTINNLDKPSATYVLGDANNNFGSPQIAGQGASTGAKNLTLIANVTSATAKIQFSIKESDGTTRTSPVFSIGQRLFMPYINKEFVFPPTNLDQTEPANNDKCAEVGPLQSGRSYIGTFGGSDTDDWFTFVVPTAGASVRFSGVGFPAASQLQVFVAADCNSLPSQPTGKVADVASPVLDLTNLPAGRLFIRLAGSNTSPTSAYTLKVELNATNGVFEDNDNPCQAVKTSAGLTYSTFSDDEYDFFEIKIDQIGTVQLNITNWPEANQLQLRSPIKPGDTACSATTSTDRVNVNGNPAFINNGSAQIVAQLAPGTYYARMGDGVKPDVNGQYQFKWTFTPGQTGGSAIFDSCAAFRDCFGDATGGRFTGFWANMPVNAEITLEMVPQLSRGACPSGGTAGSFKETWNVGSAVSGSRVFDKGIPRGWYIGKINAKDTSTNVIIHSKEFPLKMDCTFLSAAADAEPLEPTPAP
jgi:hypothetical protein